MLFSRKGGVAADHIGEGTMLKRLYRWDGLMAFIAAALGEDRLYRHADPMASLNINVFDPGQSLDWHFDRADFSVTPVACGRARLAAVLSYVREPSVNFTPYARELFSGRAESVGG